MRNRTYQSSSTLGADKILSEWNFSTVTQGTSSEFLTCIRDSGLAGRQVTAEQANLGASVDVSISILVKILLRVKKN
jgi:hypothetical protein